MIALNLKGKTHYHLFKKFTLPQILKKQILINLTGLMQDI